MELFHVTFYRFLPMIAEHGLVPSQSHGGFGGMQGYSQGFVFLTEGDGVPFWYSRLEQVAHHLSDNVLEDGMVPVVLRFDTDHLLYEPDLQLDEAGTRDSGGHESWKLAMPVPADDIFIWDGSEWSWISDWESVDPESALDGQEEETDEGETETFWYFKDYDNPLEPTEEQRGAP